MNPPGQPLGTTMTGLSPTARLLLWDHPRGSLAYDVLCFVVLVLLLLTPAGFWGDPMVGWPR